MSIKLFAICSAAIAAAAPLLITAATLPSGFDFNQNVNKAILYAVDAPTQVEMLEGLRKVDTYLQGRGISAETGNACFFFRDNPYCEVGKWYADRITDNIAKLDSEKLDEMGLLRVKNSLTEQGEKGLEAETPHYLKELSITKGDITLARLLSLAVLASLSIFLLGVASLSLIGS